MTVTGNGPPAYPTDPLNGYQLQDRDRAFLGYTEEQLRWWRRGDAPLGMTPTQFHDFRTTLQEALRQDGIALEDVEVDLKGSGVNVFSHKRKPLPTREDFADNPDAAARLRAWLGDDPNRPRSGMFDAMHKLGLERPSDIDVQISSDEMIRRVRERFNAVPGGLTSFAHHKYQFVHKVLMNEEFPSLAAWTERWHRDLRREVVPALFGLHQEPLQHDAVDFEPSDRGWQIIGPTAPPLAAGPMAQNMLRIPDAGRLTPPASASVRAKERHGVDAALTRFLRSRVDLSAAAYELLGNRVAEIQQVLRNDAIFASNENRLFGQGSCFYGTAIEPIAGRELDLDVLLEIPHREDWNPRRCLAEVERSLNASSGTAERQSRCVRVDFTDTVHVDVIPLVVWPSGERAIAFADDDSFQPVDPFGMAQWIDDQDNRSGGSLRPTVRLMKHLQAAHGDLPCPPIILTILLGREIEQAERFTERTGLTADILRLVDGVSEKTSAADRKPRVDDPSRPEVNFDHRWQWPDYHRFRDGVRQFRDNLATALATDPHATRPEAWTRVFGTNFSRFLAADASASDARIAAVRALSGSIPASGAARSSSAPSGRTTGQGYTARPASQPTPTPNDRGLG